MMKRKFFFYRNIYFIFLIETIKYKTNGIPSELVGQPGLKIVKATKDIHLYYTKNITFIINKTD